eukprot:CAMPEP_0194033890 /NCGR_PEP_ID=MMETSP0009_2-20130614/6382_1 /TAXON_ID=210454 /ORGANISM="Grammatophora oceanica, Strain CCMP 410" /LENGTH=262 /DNA_ID=CAMNT_0038674621 /DNA_START=134 /DNA_END=922 /DNA_ORIENTATION=-
MKRTLIAVAATLPAALSASMRGSVEPQSSELSAASYLEEAAQVYTPPEDFLSRGLNDACTGVAFFDVEVTFSYTKQPYELGCNDADSQAMADAVQKGIDMSSGEVMDATYQKEVTIWAHTCMSPEYVGFGKEPLSDVKAESSLSLTGGGFGGWRRGLCGGCWPWNGGGGGGCTDCGNSNCDDDTLSDNPCRRRTLYDLGSASDDFDTRVGVELESKIAENIQKNLQDVGCLTGATLTNDGIGVTVIQQSFATASFGCSGYAM